VGAVIKARYEDLEAYLHANTGSAALALGLAQSLPIDDVRWRCT
jgi:hypothetical protein